LNNEIKQIISSVQISVKFIMRAVIKTFFALFAILIGSSLAQPPPRPPIELTCIFRILAVVDVRDYGCLLENITLNIETDDPVTVTGEHSAGRGILDVRVLEIHDSVMTTIPSSIFTQLPNVEALEILDSGTFRLEAGSFFFAVNLRDIRINGNNFPRITGSPFIHARELEYIFLFNNQIEEIEPTVFAGLEKLYHLSIGVNKVKQMSAAHFAPLKSLERIYMIQNEIEVVGNDWFTANPLLTDIDIEYNRISAIGPRFLDGLNNLEYVLLSNNVCVDENFVISEELSIDDVRSGLSECFNNFLPPPIVGGNFTFDVHGNMTIFDQNGDAILRIVN
jgi:hypothetical protein